MKRKGVARSATAHLNNVALKRATLALVGLVALLMSVLPHRLHDTDQCHGDANDRNHDTGDVDDQFQHLIAGCVLSVRFPIRSPPASREFSEFPPAKGEPSTV